MNVRYAFPIIGSLLGAAVQAQDLSSPTNVPVLGDMHTVSTAPYQTPPPGGSGVTFDFSTMLGGGSATYSWISPSLYSAPEAFPTATLCLVGGPSSDSLFYTNSAEGLQLVGEKRSYLALAEVEAPYSNGPLELALPLTYDQQWTDAIASTWEVPDVGTAIRSGTITGHADAIGWILLPGMTEGTPVLRVRTYVQETITVSAFNITHRRRVDAYYTQWSRFPAFRSVADSLSTPPPFALNQNSAYTEWVSASAVGMEDQAADAFGVQVFPNPAAGQAEVTFEATGGTLTLEVFDMRGTAVQHLELGRVQAGARRQRVDVTALPVGLYTVRLTGADGARSVKPLMVLR
jgi:hypothetical protein